MNPEAPSMLLNLLPMIGIFVVFYFLVIRPQKQQEKAHQQMLEALNRGDKVVTNGGLIGTIDSLKGAELQIKLAENVKITVLRSAVMSLYKEQPETVPNTSK